MVCPIIPRGEDPDSLAERREIGKKFAICYKKTNFTQINDRMISLKLDIRQKNKVELNKTIRAMNAVKMLLLIGAGLLWVPTAYAQKDDKYLDDAYYRRSDIEKLDQEARRKAELRAAAARAEREAWLKEQAELIAKYKKRKADREIDAYNGRLSENDTIELTEAELAELLAAQRSRRTGRDEPQVYGPYSSRLSRFYGSGSTVISGAQRVYIDADPWYNDLDYRTSGGDVYVTIGSRSPYWGSSWGWGSRVGWGSWYDYPYSWYDSYYYPNYWRGSYWGYPRHYGYYGGYYDPYYYYSGYYGGYYNGYYNGYYGYYGGGYYDYYSPYYYGYAAGAATRAYNEHYYNNPYSHGAYSRGAYSRYPSRSSFEAYSSVRDGYSSYERVGNGNYNQGCSIYNNDGYSRSQTYQQYPERSYDRAPARSYDRSYDSGTSSTPRSYDRSSSSSSSSSSYESQSSRGSGNGAYSAPARRR